MQAYPSCVYLAPITDPSGGTFASEIQPIRPEVNTPTPVETDLLGTAQDEKFLHGHLAGWCPLDVALRAAPALVAVALDGNVLRPHRYAPSVFTTVDIAAWLKRSQRVHAFRRLQFGLPNSKHGD